MFGAERIFNMCLCFFLCPSKAGTTTHLFLPLYLCKEHQKASLCVMHLTYIIFFYPPNNFMTKYYNYAHLLKKPRFKEIKQLD